MADLGYGIQYVEPWRESNCKCNVKSGHGTMPCRRASLRDCDTIFYAGPSAITPPHLSAAPPWQRMWGDGERKELDNTDAPALGSRGCEGVVKKGNHVSVAPIPLVVQIWLDRLDACRRPSRIKVLRKPQLVSQSLIVPRCNTPKPASPRPMSLAGLEVGTGRSP